MGRVLPVLLQQYKHQEECAVSNVEEVLLPRPGDEIGMLARFGEEKAWRLRELHHHGVY